MLWAAAFILPPVLQPKSFSWKSQVNELSQRPARSIERISTLPIPDGSFFISDNKREIYRVLVEEGKDRLERAQREQLHLGPVAFQPTTAFQASTSLEKRTWKGQDSFRLGQFQLHKERLEFFPYGFSKAHLWNSNVGGGNWVSFHQNKRGGLLAMDPVNQRLLYFPRARDKIHLYDWDKQSHLIRFFPCDASSDLLVENVPDVGLSRFSFWVDGSPRFFTVFDFSANERRSQVTWVEAFDCRDIVVGGNFGMQRVRF